MSVTSAVAPEPRSWVSRLYHWLMEGCGLFSGLLFGAVAVLITIDVIGRNLLGSGMPWSLEASEYGLPLATFMAAPWVLYHSAHVRVDILLRTLPKRAAKMLELVVEALGGCICAALFYLTVAAALQSQHLGSMVLKVLVFPEWWLFIPVVFCFALLSVESVHRFIRTLRGNGSE